MLQAVARNYLLVFVCFVALLVCALSLLIHQKRKKERVQRKNRLQQQSLYTLPNHENTFLEERLRLISVEKEDKVKAEDFDLSLTYVREMIGKLKRKELSLPDRLLVENFSRQLTQFSFQNEYKKSELNGLNDGFLQLIKLASKYSI